MSKPSIIYLGLVAFSTSLLHAAEWSQETIQSAERLQAQIDVEIDKTNSELDIADKVTIGGLSATAVGVGIAYGGSKVPNPKIKNSMMVGGSLLGIAGAGSTYAALLKDHYATEPFGTVENSAPHKVLSKTPSALFSIKDFLSSSQISSLSNDQLKFDVLVEQIASTENIKGIDYKYTESILKAVTSDMPVKNFVQDSCTGLASLLLKDIGAIEPHNAWRRARLEIQEETSHKEFMNACTSYFKAKYLEGEFVAEGSLKAAKKLASGARVTKSATVHK